MTASPAPPLRLDLAGWTREATQGDPKRFLALFEQAERWGYDGVWFNEFRLHEPPAPYPSPLLLAAALLARTQRLRVGLSVLVLPLHQPLLLAEEIAQVDFQSGGRLDVGMGRGTDAGTLAALGIDAAATREKFEAAHRLLRATLRPGIPLYLAGSTPETLGYAVREGLPMLFSLEPPEGRQFALLEQQASEQARPPGTDRTATAIPASDRLARLLARSSLSRYVCIAPRAADAREQAAQMLPLLYQRRLHFAHKRGTAAQIPPPDLERALREQILCGTPQDCVAQLAALSERTGVRQIRLVFNGNGVLEDGLALQRMQLFAQEAMPALREAARLPLTPTS